MSSPQRVRNFRNTIRLGIPPESLDSPSDWWIVVDDGGLAVARLWRPGTGGDDLPPAPRIAKRECNFTVLAEDSDGPVAGAVVVPTRASDPGNNEVISGNRGWQVWLEPAITSTTGSAVLEVPDDKATAIRVGAPGFVTGKGVCRTIGEGANDRSVVRLRRRGKPAEFLLRTTGQGRPLPGALVRDESGWPVALTDEKGRAVLDSTASEWQVETESGATYIGRLSQDLEAATIDLLPTSAFRRGVVSLDGVGVLTARSARDDLAPEAESPPVEYWLELPERPWSGLHRAMASLRRATLDGGFGIQMLPGDRVWFSTRGRGYDACSDADIASGACPALLPGLPIRGRVLDDRGRALEDVEIRLSRRPVRRGGPSLQQFLRTRHAGRFVSDRLPAPRHRLRDDAEVTIRHPGFLPIDAAHIGHYLTENGEYVIRLQRGVVVSGTVVDRQSGNPVAGAEVGLGRFSAMGASVTLNRLSELRVGTSFLGRTGGDGRFVVRAPPGRRDFAVRSDAHAFRLIRGLEVGEVETLNIGVVLLDPAVVLRGVVLDEAANPIPDASVTAIAQRAPDVFGRVTVGDLGDAVQLRTGDDGVFVVPGLTPEVRLDIEAVASGFASRTLRGLVPGAVDPVEIRLSRGAVLEGQMTLHGEPVSGTFELFGSSHRSSQDPLSGDLGYVTSGRTRDDGTFWIAHLAPDRYRLLLQSQNGASTRVVVELETGEERWLDVDLGGRSGRISGRVADRRHGLAGVAVVLHGVGETGTDARGRFAFDDVPAGSYVLEVDPGPGELGERKAVQVLGGKQQVNFDFGRYEVSGLAILEDEPSNGGTGQLTFLASESFRQEPAVHVGADGRFTAWLRRGTHHVGGEFGGRRIRSVKPFRVRGDTTDAVLRLRLYAPPGRISGQVHGLTEGEINSLRVEAVDDDFAVREASINSDGTFLIDRVPAGEWAVAGTVGISGRRAVTRVKVRDSDTPADLVFAPGHSLKGVVHLDGAPWSGAQVLLLRNGEMTSARRQFTAHDGAFAFQDLASGRHTLAVGGEKRPVHIHGNEWADVHLQSGRAVGVVLDETALPQAGTIVLLWPAQASLREAEALGVTRRSWTDEEGRFEFDRVPSGDWSLQVAGRPNTNRKLRLAPASEVAVVVH